MKMIAGRVTLYLYKGVLYLPTITLHLFKGIGLL